MEGVIYSDTTVDKTIDYIELLLEPCRNIWIWCNEAIYKEINPFSTENVWERHVHIYHDPNITSIGDCLRELYTRDESRDNLIIIGNTNIVMPKLTLHKNLNKKHTGILLLGDGNVVIDIKGGTINKYEVKGPNATNKDEKTGRIMEIGYCTPHILAIFQDNFDCNTFHDLILSKPIGYTFGAQMDKRLKLFDDVITKEETVTETDDFIEELKEMCNDITIPNENSKLELNSLRLAHGLTYKKLLDSLQELGRNDIVLYLSATK